MTNFQNIYIFQLFKNKVVVLATLLKKVILIASNGHLTAVSDSELEEVISGINKCRGRELKRIGAAFVGNIFLNGYTCDKTRAVFDESDEPFVCFAPSLAYMNPMQEAIYIAVVIRANETGILHIVKREWNSALERLIPSEYGD